MMNGMRIFNEKIGSGASDWYFINERDSSCHCDGSLPSERLLTPSID